MLDRATATVFRDMRERRSAMLTWTARPEAKQTGIYAERDALHFWISTAVPPTKRQEGCPIGLWIKPKVPKSDSGKNDFEAGVQSVAQLLYTSFW